jgi:hypothetical protein
MTHYLKGLLCLTVILGGSALGQTTDKDEAGKSGDPVAFVYVARTLHIDGFSAASDGKLTRVPGSPFLNPDEYGYVTSMAVNKKYLFGGGIYTYSIAPDGARQRL